MAIKDAFIAELKHESSLTKKMLEKVTMEKKYWQPHEKSMSIGRLAVHVAELAAWVTFILTTEGLDFFKWKNEPFQPKSTEDLLTYFDQTVETALNPLEAASDENLMKYWTLRKGDHTIFSLPRIAAIRSMAISHLIHHRGQLSVYLRLQNVSVPGMYGPSADESF